MTQGGTSQEINMKEVILDIAGFVATTIFAITYIVMSHPKLATAATAAIWGFMAGIFFFSATRNRGTNV